MCFRKERSQFLQVNFTSKVKVVRLGVQGYDDCFVTSLSLFFSDDGVIWKPFKEGGKIKVKRRILNVIGVYLLVRNSSKTITAHLNVEKG